MLYSAFTCNAEVGSEEWNVDPFSGELTASVTLRCDIADVDDVVADILMNNRVCPFVPINPKPVAMSAGIVHQSLDEDTPATNQGNNYQDALVTIQYGIPDFEESQTTPGIKIVERVMPNTQFIEQDYRDYRWGSALGEPLRPNEAPGILDVKVTLQRQIMNVPLPLSLNTISYMGHVHNAIYTSPTLGFAFPAESLLYLDPQFDRTTDLTAGTSTANYTQVWGINMNGWNRFWRAETGTWDQIYKAGGGVHNNYPAVDLSSLLF